MAGGKSCFDGKWLRGTSKEKYFPQHHRIRLKPGKSLIVLRL
jgi:hypothetical protein